MGAVPQGGRPACTLRAVAHLEVAGGEVVLGDGRVLFHDVDLRVSDGAKVALIGANGLGKSTLLRVLAGEADLTSGARGGSGELGYLRQQVGQVRDTTTIRQLLVSLAARPVRDAAAAVRQAEARMLQVGSEASQLRYATVLTEWGDAGGYDEEVRWDEVAEAALGQHFDEVADRPVATLSGGEQKRLALESLFSSAQPVLLLDEPDNYLDVPGKRWLEQRISDSPKSVLFVSHDREVIAAGATRIATLERGRSGGTLWVFAGRFADYRQARVDRNERLDELLERWREQEQKLVDLVLMYKTKAAYNSDMASRYQSAQTRLARFRADGPPEASPVAETVTMRLRGGRTAKRAVTCIGLELAGLMRPFDAELWYGDRVAVLGSNGSGKSHLLRLLAEAGDDDGPSTVRYRGQVRLGSRVKPGFFAQTSVSAQSGGGAQLHGRTLLEILHMGDADRTGLDRQGASGVLGRYGIVAQAEQRFESLSGGQQARFQILLLELRGSTLLLLDEPTDNLDLESAESLEAALAAFDGTVVAVTHDRWFARSFDRFLIFRGDGSVIESDEPVWDEQRVTRERAAWRA